MGLHRRIERQLRIEELEPRVAPVTLNAANPTYSFLDADGDWVVARLSGRGASAILLDAGAANPNNTDIATINFTGATSRTSLTITATPTNGNGDGHTPGGRVSAVGQTVGTFIVPGRVTGLTAGGITGTLQVDSLQAADRIEVAGSVKNLVIQGDVLGEIVVRNNYAAAQIVAASAAVQTFAVKGIIPVVISGNISVPTETDTYQFTAKAGERLYFDLDAQHQGSPLDAELSLYQVNGSAESRISFNNNAHGLDPFIDYPFSAGSTYRIKVGSRNDNTTGSYDLWVSHDRLRVEPREAGDSITDAQLLDFIPAAVTGSIYDQWDQDVYKFVIPTARTLDFDLDAQLLDSHLSGDLLLLDVNGAVIAQGTTGGDPNAPLDPSILGQALLAGTYGIEVRGMDYHSDGYYKLYVSDAGLSFKDHEIEYNDTPAVATLVPIPVIINGSISYGEDRDFFRFAVSDGERVVFDVDTMVLDSALDSELVLHGTDGNILALDDNSSDLDPYIDYTFTTGGSYTIEIRNPDRLSTGAYLLHISQGTIKAAETEPNDSQSNANLLGSLPIAVDGVVSTITDADFFSFNITGSPTLFFDLSALGIGSDLQADLKLFGPGTMGDITPAHGTSGDPEFIKAFTEGDGTYAIEVFSLEQKTTGKYRLYIYDPAVPFLVKEGGTDDTPATAQAIGPFPTVIDGSVEPNTDVDYYSFALGAAQTLTFDIDAQAIGSLLDAALYLLDGAGNVITSNDDSDPNEPFPLDPEIQRALGAGNYFVKVQSSGNAAGPYRLWVYATDPKSPEFHPNNQYTSGVPVGAVRTLTQPAVIVGSLADSSQRDWYRFDAKAGETFTVDVDAFSTGSTLNPKMTVWFGTGGSLLEIEVIDDEEVGMADPFFTYAVPTTYGAGLSGSGTYYLELQSSPSAEGMGMGGDYKIFINKTGQLADVERTVDVYKPVNLKWQLVYNSGTTITGSINSATDLDRFTFTGAAGQVWAVNMNEATSSGAGLSVLMTLGGPGGAYWSSTDTNVDDSHPYINATLPYSGTYQIELRSNEGWTGDYSLSITRQTITQRDLLEGQRVVLPRTPGVISGDISTPGEMDSYIFTAGAGAVLGFEVSRVGASQLDSMLQLVDSKGRVIITNDDFAGERDALMTYRFPASGTYGVIVTGNTASTSGTFTGQYNLSITKAPSSLNGLTVTGDLAAGALVSAPGSLTLTSRIGDDLEGRLELGLDLAGPLTIVDDLGSPGTYGTSQGDLWAGGRLTGRISVGGNVESDGMVFARGVVGNYGASAPLRVNGFIYGDLVVALPGTVTGKAMVYPVDAGFAPGPDGTLKEVTLYNLDGTGRLTGPFADAQFYTGEHVIRPERNQYDFTDIAPAAPLGTFSQVEAFWQVNRYHNYMMLLGFGKFVNRSIQLFVDHPATDPGLQDNAYYDMNNRWIRFGTNTNGSPVHLGQSGTVILHEYNHAVTDELIRGNTVNLSTPFYQIGAMNEGLSDYRATSLLNQPSFSWDDPPPGVSLKDRATDNFYRYYSDNVDPDKYKTGSILSGTMWDLRHLLGPTVIDTLSMATVPSFARQIEPTFPKWLDLMVSVDKRYYGGIHENTIREAFRVHGIGNYNVTGVSNYPFYPVTPANDMGQQIDGEAYIVGDPTKMYTIIFDDLVTKIADGDSLIINGNPAPIDPGTHYVGSSYGQGLHYVEHVIPIGNEIRIDLYVANHTEGNPQASFGYRVVSIIEE